MASSDNSTFDELLFSGFHGRAEGGAELPTVLSDISGDNNSTLSASPQAVPFICGGCGKQVNDRFVLLAAGETWHGPCLRCSECQCELQTHPSLYCKRGSIYCRQDYCRLFGTGKCARCSQPIPSSAMVMRSGDMTFHPDCFSCKECDISLLPGNLYCVEGRNLYCQSHYQSKRETSVTSSTHLSNLLEEGEEPGSSPEPQLGERPQRSGSHRPIKRIRTCFRSEQLRALESYFAQKHNPDGKDWICLSSRTGLSKRVLQVWFQNARAKLRRSLSSDTPQTTLPTVPTEADTMMPCQNILNQTSTIDQEELSLLSGSFCHSPLSSPMKTHEASAFQDYNTQNAHVFYSLWDTELEPAFLMK